MSTEDVRIRVRLDIDEVTHRTQEMERGFERMAKTASSGAMKRLLGAATGAFAATIGQRTAADVGALSQGGAVGDVSQNFSNWLGFGQAARRASAVQMAREQTASALGPSAAQMSEASIRSIFNAFKRQADMKVQGEENIRKATELAMSKASAVDGGVIGAFVDAIEKATDRLQSLFSSGSSRPLAR